MDRCCIRALRTIALTGVATAKDALVGLSSTGKGWVAAMLFAAMACAATSVILGYKAAYGWPRATMLETDSDIDAWFRGHRQFAATAARRLNAAVKSALVSLAFTSTTMALVWFLPRH